jgi:chromosome partitioning protein
MLLENFKNDYDFIIVDCMPALGMLTVNALAACDSVLIPATAQYLSAKGLELLLQTIARVKKRINPNITIDGILVTMFSDRTKLTKEILNLMNDAYSEHIRIFRVRYRCRSKWVRQAIDTRVLLSMSPKVKWRWHTKTLERSI